MDVTLWNVETGERVERLKCNTYVFEVDFSPDGQKLIAARVNIVDPTTMTSTPGAVHLWDISTGELLWENETEAPRTFLSVSYHPSGEVIAFGKEHGGAGIMDVNSGEVLSYHNTEGYPNIGDLTFSPSGRLLAVGKDDFNIYVYEIADNFTLKLISTLEGHESYVNGVVFNADETLLISGSGEHDRTVGIWAVNEDFRLLNRLSGHTDSILRIDINPAGTLIASVSWDGSVNLWGIPVGSP
jgi:WD40 repeat protein